jgi:beta-galactosidase
MYQSEWTTKPMLHLFPHWNWIAGDEIDLWCYFNQADEVELFVNGKSQGVRRKADAHQYHVMWRVTFVPGEVKAVARKDGKVVRQQVIKTAGAPDHIRLSVDYRGKDLTFVTAEVVDKDGNLCPWADDELLFSCEGDGKIIGSDNGCQTSMERFTSPRRKAFFGKCMTVVRGKATLKAQSVMLKPATIKL